MADMLSTSWLTPATVSSRRRRVMTRMRRIALRRLDRSPLLAICGRCPPSRHLRFRRGGAHRGTARALARPGSLCIHTGRRSRGARVCSLIGSYVGSDSDQAPPDLLDAAIIFAPVGALGPLALKALRKGGGLVCGGIHMSDIPAMPYSLLWGERSIHSVANWTRRDGTEFLGLAGRIPVRTHIQAFALSEANVALERLRAGRLSGAAVLIP